MPALGLGAFNRHQARVRIVAALLTADHKRYVNDPSGLVADADRVVNELEKRVVAEAEIENAAHDRAMSGVAGVAQNPQAPPLEPEP